MKARLIMNPGSCSGTGRRLWSFWESALRRAHACLGFDVATDGG